MEKEDWEILRQDEKKRIWETQYWWSWASLGSVREASSCDLKFASLFKRNAAAL